MTSLNDRSISRRKRTMAKYLVQVGYTAQSWAAQVKNPANALDRVRPTAEAVGGRLECFYYCFGDYDVVVIGEFPNDQAAAAWSMGISAGGAVRSIKTTPLMDPDEGVIVMREASKVSSIYAPPV
jgi:uncharacterized protein with GYD domain